jgi:predicted thioesterase
MLGLAEQATVAAVAGALERGRPPSASGLSWTISPSPVGAELEVEAVLERVTGRRLQFAVHLRHGEGPVASGLITPVVVGHLRLPLQGWSRSPIGC